MMSKENNMESRVLFVSHSNRNKICPEVMQGLEQLLFQNLTDHVLSDVGHVSLEGG